MLKPSRNNPCDTLWGETNASVPMQPLMVTWAPLAKGNLQTPQLCGYFRGVNMFEDSDEGF